MLRKDGSEQKVEELATFLPPGLIFVVLPALMSLLGALILTMFPRLIIAYNYLRGASSPIDQYALAFLGSDLTRIMVFISCIIGMAIGLYLSRFVTAKLDVVRKEGETEISKRMFFALLFSWNFLIALNPMIWSLDSYYNGFATSRFLSDLGVFITAGYFLAFSIPVLLKYVRLVLHTKSIDSRVVLVEHRSENGFIKLKYLTLKVIYDGPDP